ncbi:hypothetical protein [Aquipseudomonas ullengensis]|uniref:Uncharacterized protein n=1 Tax=Aquipseudomonas ullengensis TaxID=2759166 RepID=A0A7W4LJD4_9GAMM|nr:hypothetical protein [Pseudomonas ullengensis]MBB2494173.1 hypothetical protein [Pseudomonas ullengensis]
MSHLLVTRTPWAILRISAALLAALALVGCSSLSGKGYLSTENSQPLQLSDAVVLKQGHMRLQFAPDPWLLGRLKLHNATADFSTWVSAGDYAGNSFFIDSTDSGLAYDIQARWREVQAETSERNGQESCTTSGFCSKTVKRLDCGRKSYREGSEAYGKHEDDDSCEEDSALETGNFPDCPGTRTTRQRYQVFKLMVTLDFLDPYAQKAPVAVFDGESQYRERLLETLDEGQCEVR